MENGKEKSLVTVAISTFNRAEYLKKCLLKIFALDRSVDYEVLVVNDGSNDKTLPYLEQFKSRQRALTVIQHPHNQGLSQGRNTAIKHAHGEIIAFTDDDCIPETNWLVELIKPFDDDQVVCTYGQVFYRALNYQGYFPERLVRNIGPKWPMGANLAYRLSAFKTVGLFDPDLSRYHNEDSEMAFRLAKIGKLVAVPRAIVIHQAMEWTPRSLLASAKNASVWPVLYRRYGNFIFGQTFQPPVRWKCIVNAVDYVYLVTLPILIPLLLIRYLAHGQRNLIIFFCKWPVYLVRRRLLIWYEAIRNRVLMI